MPKRKAAAAATRKSSPRKQNTRGEDVIALLRADHRKVEKLFQEYEKTDGSRAKGDLARQICQELVIHTLLEEEIFYPACRENEVESDILDEAQVEHDGAKVLIADILNGAPDDEFYDAKVSVLSEYIKHHVAEEEKPRGGIFAAAKKADFDLADLGAQVAQRKEELEAEAEDLLQEPLETPAVHLQNIQPARERGQSAPFDEDRGLRNTYRSQRNEDDRWRMDSAYRERWLGGRDGRNRFSQGGGQREDRGRQGERYSETSDWGGRQRQGSPRVRSWRSYDDE